MSQVVARSVSCRIATFPAVPKHHRTLERISHAPISFSGGGGAVCPCTSRSGQPGRLENYVVVSSPAFLGSVKELSQQRRASARASQRTGGVVAELPSLNATEAVPVTVDGALQKFPAAPGVYAVFDSTTELQYIGLSRKVSTSIEAHTEDLPELISTVKVAVVQSVDRAALQAAWKSWIEEYVQTAGKVPPGNVSGNDAWTKRKARSAKPEIRLTPGAHVKLTVPLEEIIDKVVKDVSVVAFIKGTRTAPQCGFSHKVLTLLNESRVDYEVVNVLDEEHNPGLRDAIKQYSQWPTIPQVFVNGEFVGGADILEEMVQKNELKALIKK